MKTKVISRNKIKDIFFQVFCIVLGLILVVPVIYAVLISFMPQDEILTTELNILPSTFGYLENYKIVFEKTQIFRFMFNSFIMAFVSSIVRIIVASLGAYSFAFFEYKGKNLLFGLVVGSMIIPADVLVVQNYFTVSDMGLINTYLGMMITFFISGMNVFIMRQNFLTYSKSIREAALVDGCSNFKFYARILMPSNISSIMTVFISSFVGTWNTYLWPLLVTNVDEMRTAQVAVTMLNVNEGSSYGPGAVMAAATVILIPSVLVFLIFQRKIVGGMMAGAVKG